jgi:hypothetical protein
MVIIEHLTKAPKEGRIFILSNTVQYFFMKLFKVIPWDLIDNYSKESTIHGMKYLGEKKQPWVGK